MVVDSTLYRDLAYVFTAAVAGGLVARKFRQPLILGYVAGGILISPFTPGPTVSDTHSLELFAEIGVILLMFSIGLEFHIKDLLKVKWVAAVGGTLGIVGSMLLGLGIGRLMGWTAVEGLVIGAIISVASTMVLARFLIDRGELRSERGRVMIGITLVEDMAVVVLTVVLPSLAMPAGELFGAVAGALLKATLLLVPLGFLAARVVPSLMRRLMRVYSQELFLLMILALSLGTAVLTQAVGLSLAVGAFVAGLVVSGSDYAREALSNLFPLRDAFVALFFVTVGMLIDPSTLMANLGLLAALVMMIVIGKALIWTAVVRIFGYGFWTALGVALGLTQIGEFSFILVQVARGANLVGEDVYNATLAASLVSILINAFIWRFVLPSVDKQRASGTDLEIELATRPQQHIVLCGFGRIGGAAGAALDTFNLPYVIVEIDPDVVRAARSRKLNCLFGDPSRRAVLEAANVEAASIVIVTIPEADRAYLTIRNIRALNPTVPVLARAHRRADHELLMTAGATKVVQPETEAAATMIGETLEIAGVGEADAIAYLGQYRKAMELASPRLVGRHYALPELFDVPADVTGAVGKQLKDSGIREHHGITVVRIRRASGETILNPDATTVLCSGDILQVLGLLEDLSPLRTRR